MDITIEERRLIIGGHPLVYHGYFFDHDEYEGVPNSEVLRGFLAKWARAISGLASGGMLYLPFSPDDQLVECVEAKVSGDRVGLRHVWVSGPLYAANEASVDAFMAESYGLNRRSPNRPLGVYGKEEFVSALLNPSSLSRF